MSSTSKDPKKYLHSRLSVDNIGTLTQKERYLVKVNDHDVVEENLESIYGELDSTTILSVKENGIDNAIPDVTLKFDDLDVRVALEVKINSSDFKKALWQCRMYAIGGALPYVAVPTYMPDIDCGLVEDTLFSFRHNTPGYLKLGTKHITVERHPSYNI